MIKKILWVGLIFVTSTMGKSPSLVNISIVKKGSVNPLEEFIGTVSFSKKSQISSQSSGAVIKVNFEAGDRVKKEDILIEIDSELLNAKITSAKALLEVSQINLNNMQKDLNRYKQLIIGKAISQKIFDDSHFKSDTAKQTFNYARSTLDELEIQKKKKVIVAPFDGVIVQKNTEISQWLKMGDAVATLVDTQNIDFTFNLPTSYLYKLKKNSKYEINLGEKIINSMLYASIPKGDKVTRTYPVKFKAKVENKFIYEGMEAKIKLPRNKKIEALIVPRDAVIKRFGKNVVFVVNDKFIVAMIPVTIVGYEKESIAIFGRELDEGMRVVVKGNERISPNTSVKIIGQ